MKGLGIRGHREGPSEVKKVEGDPCVVEASGASMIDGWPGPSSSSDGLTLLSERMKAGEEPSGFEGEAAMIIGLVGKPEHNGKCGRFGKYIKETDRFCFTILADMGPDGNPRPPMNLKIH